MRAVLCNSFSGPEELSIGEIDDPKPAGDEILIDVHAASVSFMDCLLREGKAFAAERAWSGNMREFIEWLRCNYPHKFRSDPIGSWRAQAKRLRTSKSPHAALSTYQSFMAATSDFREAIDESAAAAEREIDMLIDRARGK